MSQENVEIARRLWGPLIEGGASGQATGVQSAEWHPEVEYIEDPNWPGAGVYRGPQAIQARFAKYLEVFGPTEMILQEVIGVGDEVVSIFRTRGESAHSGLPFEHEWAYVWRFRDGRVVEWRAYFEKDKALAAVGQSE